MPVFRPLPPTGTQRVPLDIPHDLIKPVVGFDREELEVSLKEVPFPDLRAVFLPVRHVRGGQPLQEGRQFVVQFGPQNKMPVVSHQVVGTNPDRMLLRSFGKDSPKYFEFGWFGKEPLSAHTTID